MKIIGLDVGTKRIGVSKADSSVKIAIPYGLVGVDGNEFEKIEKLAKIYGTSLFVIGLPRNNQGEETAQSKYVRNFAKNLKTKIPAAKIKFQDESLTSVLAKENLRHKKGGINKKAGDVDTEAAVLILQDFLESYSRNIDSLNQKSTPKPLVAPTPPIAASAPLSPLKPAKTEPKSAPRASIKVETAALPSSEEKPLETPEFKPRVGKPYKKGYKKWLIIRILIILAIFLGLSFIIAKIWYSASLKPVLSADCSLSENADSDACKFIEFKVESGTSVSEIAEKLNEAGLIKNPLAFKIYAKLNKNSSELKAGTYKFKKSNSVEEIITALVEGATSNIVFRLTVLPGETIVDFKKRLTPLGYSEEDIDSALSAKYSYPALAGKPDDASLEGYLYGETYEFYQDDPVDKIIGRMLEELSSTISKNNLKNKFESRGLTLYQGIILASIIQKEAGNLSLEEQKNIASVFYNRLEAGMNLGSDVTVTYALNQLSAEERAKYTDNAEKLTIDSCYNTRLHTGLPCGPISSPGAFALIAAANPSETSYLYFLTGDDGMMYYSDTDSGHSQNILEHCQELCNVGL